MHHRPYLGCLAASFAAILAASPALAETITVFAAASLKSALTEIGAQWQVSSGHSVTFSFAGTSTLARQIQQGAPADIFIAASADWMDEVIASGDVRADTRRDILGNTLVLIAHDPAAKPITLTADVDLAAMLGGGKLGMALVDAVPAGIYGKQALQSLGLWDAVAGQIAQADSVAGALNFVITGAVPFGVVYATDVKGVQGAQVIGTFPAGSHEQITYTAALTAQAKPTAQAFLDFLRSSSATAIWENAGFNVLK